ncbi:MAG: hypothetical protein M1368_12575 [Thaumarchaeota archaeon]|nr:hypothetical protein [Nitrososphaerota archaeon]
MCNSTGYFLGGARGIETGLHTQKMNLVTHGVFGLSVLFDIGVGANFEL